jgi:protein phosphatase
MSPQTLAVDTSPRPVHQTETRVELIGDGGLVVRANGLTDRGRQRPNNEDQFLIADMGAALRARQTSLKQGSVQLGRPRGHLLVVADGVGGMAGGEAASALAVGVVEQVLLDTVNYCEAMHDGQIVEPAALERAVTEADDRLHREARRRPELHGMGTTLTLAYVVNHDAFVAHVGDSRCYLLRDGCMHRLTHDHTLVDELVRRGVIKAEEAAGHRLRHVIINVVGGADEGVNVEIHRVPLRAGDRLLLCSDGLTEMIPDGEIQSILASEDDTTRACQRLVDRANENGGKDNVTVVVARLEEAP